MVDEVDDAVGAGDVDGLQVKKLQAQQPTPTVLRKAAWCRCSTFGRRR